MTVSLPNEPLKIRVECPHCKNSSRFARRHCGGVCEGTGFVYIRVDRNPDGTVTLEPDKIMEKAVITGSAPRPRPGEEQ